MEITLTNVRIAFPDLFTAKVNRLAAADSKPKYSASFLVAGDSAQKASVDKHIQDFIRAELGDKAAAFIKKFWNDGHDSCWVDGDDKEYDGYAGSWVFKCNRSEDKGRPNVRDRNGNPLTETDGVIYAGCVVNAKVDLYVQNGDYKGIRGTLLGVQFVRDAPAFGMGTGTGSQFAAIEDDDEESLA